MIVDCADLLGQPSPSRPEAPIGIVESARRKEIIVESIRQKKMGIASTFDFADDKLHYTTTDRGGDLSFSAPYDALSLEEVKHVALPRSEPTKYLWAAGLPLGFVALRIEYAHTFAAMMMGGVGFALIFLGILASDRKWFVTKVDLIPVLIAGSTPLRILHDANRDAILRELAERRRKTIRGRGITLDLSADPKHEGRRFDWLFEQGIIDAAEHAHAVGELRRQAAAAANQDTAEDDREGLDARRAVGALH